MRPLFSWPLFFDGCMTCRYFVLFILGNKDINLLRLQVSLWDGIIPSKEHAKFWIHTTNKYRFIDQVGGACLC